MELTRWDNGETIHGSEHVTIKECVEDAIKKDVSLYRVDLRYAELIGADLRDADLRDAVLRDAVLRDAVLIGADLRRANLRHAYLRYADLRRANLRYAELRYAELRYAELIGADLTGANMSRVDLDSSSWPLWCGSCGVKLDKENNERFAYHAMINMDQKVLAEFLQNPVEFANRFAEREDIDKIKAGEE